MSTAKQQWEDTIAWARVVAGCIVKQDGKYLMVQEKQKRAYGLWNLPAGHVDKGETIEDAAVREVAEETGLRVELLEKIGIYQHAVENAVKHAFTARITGGELRPQPDEILDVRWLSFEEIAELQTAGKIRSPWIWQAVQVVEERTAN